MLRPRALFEENFCGWSISSAHIEREVQPRMFASLIEVSNLLCYLVFTQTSSLRPLQVWIRLTRWFLVSLRQSGKEVAGKIVVAKVRKYSQPE